MKQMISYLLIWKKEVDINKVAVPLQQFILDLLNSIVTEKSLALTPEGECL